MEKKMPLFFDLFAVINLILKFLKGRTSHEVWLSLKRFREFLLKLVFHKLPKNGQRTLLFIWFLLRQIKRRELVNNSVMKTSRPTIKPIYQLIKSVNNNNKKALQEHLKKTQKIK